MRIIVIAVLCVILSGCDALEAREKQRAAAEGQPYRPGVISREPVQDSEGLPIQSPRWFRQSGLNVLALEHGWIVRDTGNHALGLTFVPRPQQ
jgi:hypothetical protein